MAGHVTVEGVRAADVAGALGPTVAERGRRYARDGAVLYSEWHRGTLQLRAVVRSGEGQVFSTIVHFDAVGQGGLGLVDGECSCPVGVMCKHVAAAALSAVPAAGSSVVPARESRLGALLGTSAPGPPRGTGTLANELTPDGAGGLMARLMRPGGATGWVYGGLLWNRMLQGGAQAEHDRRRSRAPPGRRALQARHHGQTDGERPGVGLRAPVRRGRDRLRLPRRHHPRSGGRHRRVQGRRRPGVTRRPQGGWVRSQPHRGRLPLPARSVVEPGRGGAGDRPDPPDRAGADGDGLPADPQDTIEEKVRALAQRKAALTAGVMDDGVAFAGALGADAIRALVS